MLTPGLQSLPVRPAKGGDFPLKTSRKKECTSDQCFNAVAYFIVENLYSETV